MVQEMSIGEAGKRLEELSERVHDTGEPVVLEKQGEPIAAVVSIETLRDYERLRSEGAAREFRRLAKLASEARPYTPTETELAKSLGESKENYGT